MQPIIIIPAYKPENSLLPLVDELCQQGFSLIVVNDGSGAAYAPVFTTIEKNPQVRVLHHAVNLGKGQALKTAFNYFLLHANADCCGVVTADADGQHLVPDIINVASALVKEKQSLWLGVRCFKQGVPFRSRFGNNLTRYVFKLLVGQSLQDTQTGLRAIPRDLLGSLLKTTSVGYEFELDMLIIAARAKRIKEIPIETVYKDENKSSHFNPLIDSLKIYFVFLRFLAFAIISGLFDYCAFLIAFAFCGQIFLSEGLARIFSVRLIFCLIKSWCLNLSKRCYLRR